MEKPIQAYNHGLIKIDDFEIDVYVLEDGIPLINIDKLVKELRISKEIDVVKEIFSPIMFKKGIHNHSAYYPSIIYSVSQYNDSLKNMLDKFDITDIIFEATNYKKYNKPDILRMLIDNYLNDKEKNWTKEFPDQFYLALDKIYRDERSISFKRPKYYSEFIKKYIFNSVKLFGFKKEVDSILAMVWMVTALLLVSSNERGFKGYYERFISNFR